MSHGSWSFGKTEMVNAWVSCNTIKAESLGPLTKRVPHVTPRSPMWFRARSGSDVRRPRGSMGVANVSSKLYPGSASPTNLRIRISKLQAQALKILAFIGYSFPLWTLTHLTYLLEFLLVFHQWRDGGPKPSGKLVEELRIPLPGK